jgi:hypothetical protein
MHDVFHVSLLRPFKESGTFTGRRAAQVFTYLPISEEPEWYTVSRFLDYRRQGRTVQYRVRWDGYDKPEYDTWEPAPHLRRDLGARTFGEFVKLFEEARQSPKTQPKQQKRRRRQLQQPRSR